MRFVCTACGRVAEPEAHTFCCECGGVYRLDFTPPLFDPALIDLKTFNLFRYRAFLPVPDAVWRDVTLGEGMTPTVSFGDALRLKLDYAMPTLSFKDRGAVLLICLCKMLGVKRVLQDSSGNAGISVAAYCARAGIACEIYVPKGTSPQKIAMIQAYGAKAVIFEGTRDATADACRTRARKEGLYYASHVFNPLFYQGTKTYLYEVFEELGYIPHNLFIPVGNGTLLLGCRLALAELFRAGLIAEWPKLFLVQSERCAPLYHAGEAPRAIIPKPTLAEGIAIGQPARGAELLTGYPGEQEVILAREEAILPARQALAHGGFFVEHTTAATYAAYLAVKATRELSGEALIPLCGAGLKSTKGCPA